MVPVASLRSCSLFAGLTEGCTERLSERADEVIFKQGYQILTEGGDANRLYFVLSGKVALSARSPGRGQLLVQTLGPGEVLGLSWLAPNYHWHFDAHALEEVRALAVDAGQARAWMEADPYFAGKLLMSLVPVLLDRLQQTRVRLLDVYAKGQEGDGGSAL